MTRKRRYLISAAVLAACICIALGVLALLPPRPGVTKANFDRIEVGMTIADVDEKFAPLSELDERIEDFLGEESNRLPQFKGKRHIQWDGREGICQFLFDANGRVEKKTWHDHEPSFIKRFFRGLMPN
jgi:hypothetical protein